MILMTESPCIKLCQIKGRVCSGCGRRLEEIRLWRGFTDAQKHKINERILNESVSSFGGNDEYGVWRRVP
jgi:predicted Fe-S protein YdhL (DUF1289 family)